MLDSALMRPLLLLLACLGTSPALAVATLRIDEHRSLSIGLGLRASVGLTQTEPGKPLADLAIEGALAGALVRSWGLRVLRVRREAVALNGKVQQLTLSVHPEDAPHLLWAIPRANKAVVHRFYEGVNRRELGLIDEVVSPDFVQHSSLPIGPGREGLKEYFTRFWKASRALRSSASGAG